MHASARVTKGGPGNAAAGDVLDTGDQTRASVPIATAHDMLTPDRSSESRQKGWALVLPRREGGNAPHRLSARPHSEG